MFSKVLILALAVAVTNCQFISSYATGGIPTYRTSANYGGLYSANGYGYGANLGGRIGGLGALRTGGIIGSGALGYGTGGLLAGGAYKTGVVGLAAPAVSAVKVGGYGLGGIGYGSGLGIGYGRGVGLGVAGLGLGGIGVSRGISVHNAGPVNAAVTTLSRTVDYRPIPYTGEAAAIQDIDVPPQESPLRINFQSKSSPLLVSQQHIPAEPGQVQVTQSEDEPQQLVHNVARSVHQQVNEVVQPYRSLTQTVEPVIEQTHTNIAQGEGVRLTGLQSGVIGGTGQLAASGLGIAGYGVGLARPQLGLGYGVSSYGLGNGIGYGSGLGYGVSGLYGSRVGGLGLGGVYGTKVSGLGYGGLGGLGGVYGSRISSYGSGLGGLGGVYGSRLSGYGSGLYGGYGSGLGLSGLSGLSTYGTTTKIGGYY